MGICLSCLGLRQEDEDNHDRTRLLFDDPYSSGPHGYGTWGAPSVPQTNQMSPEETRKEREALDTIMRWAGDQIVEIFPYQFQRGANSNNNTNSAQNGASTSQLMNGNGDTEGVTNSSNFNHGANHQDILLAMIPGDKSKRSIRIYPASRPGSKDAESIRSKSSGARFDSHKNRGSTTFVKLQVDLP